MAMKPVGKKDKSGGQNYVDDSGKKYYQDAKGSWYHFDNSGNWYKYDGKQWKHWAHDKKNPSNQPQEDENEGSRRGEEFGPKMSTLASMAGKIHSKVYTDKMQKFLGIDSDFKDWKRFKTGFKKAFYGDDYDEDSQFYEKEKFSDIETIRPKRSDIILKKNKNEIMATNLEGINFGSFRSLEEAINHFTPHFQDQVNKTGKLQSRLLLLKNKKYVRINIQLKDPPKKA